MEVLEKVTVHNIVYKLHMTNDAKTWMMESYLAHCWQIC